MWSGLRLYTHICFAPTLTPKHKGTCSRGLETGWKPVLFFIFIDFWGACHPLRVPPLRDKSSSSIVGDVLIDLAHIYFVTTRFWEAAKKVKICKRSALQPDRPKPACSQIIIKIMSLYKILYINSLLHFFPVPIHHVVYFDSLPKPSPYQSKIPQNARFS